ncbi:MAG: serpin family protein [Eubacterium sp.]|nr:serpin family protein [Eubacterium sp.]
MKKRVFVVMSLIACLTAGSVLGGCGSGTDLPGRGVTELTDDPKSVVCLAESETDLDAVKDFSLVLFAESLGETNPVLSPVSAYLAMSMTGAGAAGETAEEFQTVFGERMVQNADTLMDALPEDEETLVVNIANSAWIDDDFTAREDWIALVSEYFESEVFQTNLPGAMKSINSWVEDKTEGLIDSILSEPLSEDARLVLMNAIYFNGKWVTPFEPSATREDVFTKEDGTVIQADMMQAYMTYFPYIKNETMDGVVLPYREGNYVFVAVKPTAGQTVRELYASLTVEKLEAMLEGQEDTFMNLKLPKFQVEYDRVLNEDFINMGLPSAFISGKADFSGLGTSADGLPINIDFVRQKAAVIVDEEGTEAAAVTAVVDEAGSAMPLDEPIEVFFDEPFLYMIYDTETEIPLFMGILDAPLSSHVIID